MERNRVFCFSGTGNSLKAAKDAAQELGDTEIVLMKGESKGGGKFDRVGFVFPCYASGAPKAVLAYIKALEICADTADYFFAIVTCGGAGKNSLPMLRDALLQKGITLDYSKELCTVGNYIAMYELHPGVEQKVRIADKSMKIIAQEIKEKAIAGTGKATFGMKLFYKAGNQYFKMNARKLGVSDACTACGICEKLCPTKSIRLENGKPAFARKSCAQCMACIQWCPAKAINCGKKTVGRTRYHHPDICTGELM